MRYTWCRTIIESTPYLTEHQNVDRALYFLAWQTWPLQQLLQVLLLVRTRKHVLQTSNVVPLHHDQQVLDLPEHSSSSSNNNNNNNNNNNIISTNRANIIYLVVVHIHIDLLNLPNPPVRDQPLIMPVALHQQAPTLVQGQRRLRRRDPHRLFQQWTLY